MSDAEQSQRKKIGAAVVLLLVAVFIYFFFVRSAPVVPDGINFVCVISGKTYRFDRMDVREVPMPNPSTGQKTLLPCVVADGKVRVDPHYRPVLETIQGDKCVDPATLEVRKP